MPMTKTRSQDFDSKMLALSDELFEEFDELPVRLVFSAISSSWADLRLTPATLRPPEAIVARARHKLAEASDRRAPTSFE